MQDTRPDQTAASKNELIQTIHIYIDAKKALTKCMQDHFRQLCQRCDKYGKCQVYAHYFDSWIRLQKIVGRAK